MASKAALDHVAQIKKHMDQVAAGEIPADSPPTFVKPEGAAAMDGNKPWFFGPDYHPTPEAEAYFESHSGVGDDTPDPANTFDL